MKKKVYCAGGWFDEKQARAMEFVYNTANEYENSNLDSYQPRRDCLFDQENDNSNQIFATNVSKIDECDAIFASVEGKDMGTLFECGYAYAKLIPIVYIWLENEGYNFNIMLAKSATRVCMNEQEVLEAFWDLNHNNLYPIEYTGDME